MSHTTVRALKPGEVGVIDGLVGDLEYAKRLADMGFVRGMSLVMLRPGTPCIVRLQTTCFGLGRAHQASIRLRTDESKARGPDGNVGKASASELSA